MNATPLDENLLTQTPATSNHKKYGIMIGVVTLVALVLGVVGYTLRSQVTTTQTTSTKAGDLFCGGNRVEVQCRNGDRKCADPGGTFDVCGDGCKRVNPCVLKCRNAQGLEQFINECEQEPTQPAKLGCTAPNVCVDPAVAQVRGCIGASANAGTCSLDGTANGIGLCCPPEEKSCPAPKTVTNVTISCPKCAI